MLPFNLNLTIGSSTPAKVTITAQDPTPDTDSAPTEAAPQENADSAPEPLCPLDPVAVLLSVRHIELTDRQEDLLHRLGRTNPLYEDIYAEIATLQRQVNATHAFIAETATRCSHGHTVHPQQLFDLLGTIAQAPYPDWPTIADLYDASLQNAPQNTP